MNENQKSLTRKEEIIMLSILNLGEEGYLVAIVDHLSELTGKTVSVTSVYFPLTRLENLGWIESHFGSATAVRGGRRKKIYKVTKLGFRALDEYKRITDLLWQNYMTISHPKD